MTAPCSEFPNDNPALHAGARWVCREVTGPAAVVTPTQPAIEVEAAPPEVEATVEAAPPEVEAAPPEVEAAPPEVEAAPPEPEPEPDSFPLPEPEPEHPVVVVDAFDGGFIDERSQDEGDVGEPPLIVEELEPFEVVCEEGSALAEAACGTEAPAESDGEAPAARDSEAPPAGADPFSVLVCALADVAIAHGAHEIAELLPRLLGEGSLDAPLSDAARATLEASGVLEGGAVAPSVVTIAGAWRAILRGESEDYGACGAAMLDEWASELLGRVLGERARANDLRRELRARGVAAFGLIEASA